MDWTGSRIKIRIHVRMHVRSTRSRTGVQLMRREMVSANPFQGAPYER
uniref:Uncharacterized protein n=1 Tax=Picea glauca TaxID=3330 RepID=A0A117NHK2_PICGL|nr:hypothetical protein ABT39_MTgene4455 [Picea glauca]